MTKLVRWLFFRSFLIAVVHVALAVNLFAVQGVCKLESHIPEERRRALNAIVTGGDDDAAYAALETAIADTSWTVQKHAIWLLGQRQNPRSIQLLSTLTASPDADVRLVALQAAVETRLWDALPMLIDSLSDSDRRIVHASAVWLALLTGENRRGLRDLKDVSGEALEVQWRRWWDLNKQNYPPGGLSSAPRPRPRQSGVVVPGLIGAL